MAWKQQMLQGQTVPPLPDVNHGVCCELDAVVNQLLQAAQHAVAWSCSDRQVPKLLSAASSAAMQVTLCFPKIPRTLCKCMLQGYRHDRSSVASSQVMLYHLDA